MDDGLLKTIWRHFPLNHLQFMISEAGPLQLSKVAARRKQRIIRGKKNFMQDAYFPGDAVNVLMI